MTYYKNSHFSKLLWYSSYKASRFTPAQDSENYLICEKRISSCFNCSSKFQIECNINIFLYMMTSRLCVSSRMDGLLSLYNQISFSEKAGQVMLDLVIAVGTLSRSQINNDRGSLIAIYEPQSSWETYFKP